MSLLILFLIAFAAAGNPMLSDLRDRLAKGTTPAESTVTDALRSGPIPAMYRVTMSNGNICRKPRCSIATDSFGTIGVVDYTFNDTHRNIQGRSTQTILMCRCLNEACTSATPVRVVERGDEDVCAVWEDGGDCFEEILRETGVRVEPKDVQYGSFDPQTKDYWRAEGSRERNLSCGDMTWSAKSIGELEVKGPGKQFTCDAKVELIQDDSEECVAGYQKVLDRARYLASQQDCYAVAKSQQTWLSPPSGPLVSDVELLLSCSATMLGILFVWSLCCKSGKDKRGMKKVLIVVQVVSFALDALAIHAVLVQEVQGRGWRSSFAFIDGVGGGGVLGIVVVVGEVRFRATRVGLVAGIVTAFDVIAAVIVILTAWGVKFGQIKVLTNQVAGVKKKDDESEDEEWVEDGDSSINYDWEDTGKGQSEGTK